MDANDLLSPNATVTADPSQPDWPAIMRDYANSGLSQPAYCKAHGLSYNQFGYQRQKIKGKRGKNKNKFTSMKAPLSSRQIASPDQSSVLIKVNHGLVINVPSHWPMEKLVTLVNQLRFAS